MFRNFTLLTLVALLLTLIAAPAVFAGQSAAAEGTSLVAPSQESTSAAVAESASASLVDRLMGFVVGIFSSASDGGADNASGPTERGPSFDPNNRS